MVFYRCFLVFVIYTENNGVIRSYALLAIGAGALVYRAGPGKVLLNLAVRLMEKILTPIRKWRKRLKFQWNRVKLFVGKQKIVRDIRECRNEEKKKRNLQNRIAMLSITFVVAILFIAMMTQSISVEKQLSQYQQELEELDNKMTEETERTKEIDDMKEYMETDEYAEEVARDKLGLVKDNEIVFKEQE